ncbi:MAG: nucleoside deaminase [Candidatus Obscuribacterales bacterium]|nr:nucleoside deaminase [Candidatus Obscuribacterales bacterium]
MKKISQFRLIAVSMLALLSVCLLTSLPVLSADDKSKRFFGDQYDPATCQMNAVPCDELYPGIPKPEPKHDHFTYVQPWSGYCPESNLADKNRVACLPCQTANIKGGGLYDGIEVQGNKWAELACAEARLGAEAGGGPFGAVIVQVDDESGKVIRYWRNHNHVIEWSDPTAHAETTVLRAACKELGVLNLGHIEKNDPHLKMPQSGKTSHCDFYASTEPCPMCYTAIRRAGLTNLIFASTRFDAGVQGIDLPLDANYTELQTSYNERAAKYGMHVYQSTVPNSLDGYNLYKRTNVPKY